tara:strand:+ start:399 stop:572 length:174 start_codon:yes stop_codon:yes gene_type:complete
MSDLEHVLHASVITAVAYVVMLYGLKQSPSVAETNSLALGSGSLAYMLIFGHKLPKL